MKKIIVILIMMASGMSILKIGAQTTTSFGLKLNGNRTNVKISDLENGDDSFKPGISFGAFTKIEFSEHFALQPELILSYTEKKIWDNREKPKFKYGSAEIPVYAIGQFTVGNGKLFVGVGPHIGYGVSVDSRKEYWPDDAEGVDDFELTHWYMGGGVIAGYEFGIGFIINAGYQLGYDLGSKGKEIDTRTFSFGIGYKF